MYERVTKYEDNAHNAALGPNLTPNILVDFINANGNILVALSSTIPASSSLTAFLSEIDVALPAERTGIVVDHFNYDAVSAAEAHDVLVLDAPTNVRPGLKEYFEVPGVLSYPRGAGHTLGSGALLTPVVRAPSTAYSYNPKDQAEAVDPDDLFAAGKQLALVSVFQARNSARVTIVGSAEMLQDKWLDASVSRPGGKKTKTENREFAKRISGWTFQEIGVLKVNKIEHQLKGDNQTNSEIYRIKNEVVSFFFFFFWQCLEKYSLSVHLTKYSLLCSPTVFPCPSMSGTRGCLIRHRLPMTFSSNSPCSRPFIA